MSDFTDEALVGAGLVFVPTVWGICTCGQDQFSQNKMFENGFKLGSYS